MKIQDKQFKDVRLTPQFIEDWGRVPERVKNRVTTIVNMIAASGRLPPSLNVHRTDKVSNLWIAYATVTGQHYRIHFTWDTEGVLILLSLVTHNEQDRFLRKTSAEDRKQIVKEHT